MQPPHKMYHLDQTPWVPLGEIERLGAAWMRADLGASRCEALLEIIAVTHHGIPPAIAGFLAGVLGKAWPEDYPAEMPGAEFRLGYPALAVMPSFLKRIALLGRCRGAEALRTTPEIFAAAVKYCVKGHRGVSDADGRPFGFQFAPGEHGVPVVAPKTLDRYQALGITWPLGSALIALLISGMVEDAHV